MEAIVDPFLLYLAVINVVTFLALTIDFFMCARNPDLQDSLANALFPVVLSAAGGAVGMIVALFIFTGLLSKHRINKYNVAWWFEAIIFLIIWVVVVAVKLGFISLDASFGVIFAGWDLDKLKILGVVLGVVNLVTFIVFVWDKHVAANGNNYGKRAPEARLLVLCLLGGSIGGMIAMYAVRHKTKKWYFVWGLPVFLVLDIAAIVLAHMGGLI